MVRGKSFTAWVGERYTVAADGDLICRRCGQRTRLAAAHAADVHDDRQLAARRREAG